MSRFGDGFLWGVATSACQVEGGAVAHGRGDSIWDVFARRPGKVADGASPATACDHFHRYRADAALMARLGIGAYRFSIAWPRVFPRGYGAVNGAGLDFYDSLTDTLLEHAITPLATLYHWDLPQGLQERGGWPVRDTARYFADFTEQVARRLGDRVSLWATLNEPQAAAHLGHEHGVHAPGLRGLGTALQAAHHLLLAHGLAVEVLRDLAPRAQVGIALNVAPVHVVGDGAGDGDADAAAAERADGYFNRWYLDPLLRGSYPEDLTDAYRELNLLPEMHEYDHATIAAPLDFVGVNYYFRYLVAADGSGGGLRQRELGFRVVESGGAGTGERTAMGWEVYPSGLTEAVLRVAREYAPAAIYITENGAAYADDPGADDAGRYDDGARQEYLYDHLKAAAAANDAGAPLRGYFVWSLLDNFEWQHGYRKRFGLVHVDFRTGARTPRQSAFWYRDVIAAGGVD